MLHFGKLQHFGTPQGTVNVRKLKKVRKCKEKKFESVKQFNFEVQLKCFLQPRGSMPTFLKENGQQLYSHKSQHFSTKGHPFGEEGPTFRKKEANMSKKGHFAKNVFYVFF